MATTRILFFLSLLCLGFLLAKCEAVEIPDTKGGGEVGGIKEEFEKAKEQEKEIQAKREGEEGEERKEGKRELNIETSQSVITPNQTSQTLPTPLSGTSFPFPSAPAPTVVMGIETQSVFSQTSQTPPLPYLELPNEEQNKTLMKFFKSKANQYIQEIQEQANDRVDDLLWDVIDQVYEFDHSEVKLLEAVGKGGLGLVYKGLLHGTIFAVKTLLADKKDRVRLFEKEIELTRRFRHPNFVNYIGSYKTSSGEPHMIVEYMAGGTLSNFVANYQMTWATALHICLQLARGLQFLHLSNPPLLYRDLKMQNIMVSDAYATEVKFVDLGMVILEGKPVRTSTGTPDFMPPEVVEGHFLHRFLKNYTIHRYTTKVDVYSFAVVMFCIFAEYSHTPFPHYPDTNDVMLAIKNGLRPNLTLVKERFQHPLLISLLQNCLKTDPKERPNMTEVIAVLHQLRKEHLQFNKRNCTAVRTKYAPIYPELNTTASSANLTSSVNGTTGKNETDNCSDLYLFNDEQNDFVKLLRDDQHYVEKENKEGVRKRKPKNWERSDKKAQEEREKEKKLQKEKEKEKENEKERAQKLDEEKKNKQAQAEKKEKERSRERNEKDQKDEQEDKFKRKKKNLKKQTQEKGEKQIKKKAKGKGKNTQGNAKGVVPRIPQGKREALSNSNKHVV